MWKIMFQHSCFIDQNEKINLTKKKQNKEIIMGSEWKGMPHNPEI